MNYKTALYRTAFFVMLACSFGAMMWMVKGPATGMQFFTGYALEMSLSFDNVFVISLIFGALGIPAEHRQRVLFWGVIGAMVLRGIFIVLGAAIVSQFEWVLIGFAAFLIYSGVKMLCSGDAEEEIDVESSRTLKLLRKFVPVSEGLVGQRFFVRSQHGRLFATPLFAALCMVEIADVIFAVDSIPATFAVTTDPLIVYSSNIFAILGLRSLFFVLETAIARFASLSTALAAVLVFIGGKVIADQIFDIHISTPLSLGIVIAMLVGGIGYSLFKTRGNAK